ncbi:MAG: hypothetical protein AAFU71_11105, partial [Cyanobacteria bacterium J06632_22]
MRLLLYVEWILLSMGALVSITATLVSQTFPVPWPELSLFGLISVMGLYLPLIQFRAKVLYTGIELSLFAILVIRCLDHPLMMRMIPLLGLVLVIRSCQIFQTRGRLLVAIFTFGLHVFASLALGQTIMSRNLPQLVSSPTPWQVSVFQTNVVILYSLILLFVILMVDALLSAHRKQRQLEVAHSQLQQYARRVEGQAALQERNRIAREIH